MPAFIDKSPYTGLEHWVDENEDDEIRHYVQGDIEPTLDYCKEMRAGDSARRHMKKHGILHFATLDPVAIMKMITEDGVNPLAPDCDQKKLFRLLNTKYKHLKTTDMIHTVKH